LLTKLASSARHANAFVAGHLTVSIAHARSSRMLTRLEHETCDHHAAAEADRLGIADEPTPASYGRFLAAAFQLELAIESQLVYVAGLSLRFIAASLRTGLLGQDLLALGRHHGQVMATGRAFERACFRDVLEALGWMYVVQRNTLHHGALYRALEPQLHPTLQLASRYLTAHVNPTCSFWHELGTQLDAAATTAHRADEIVAAARCAFERQHAWFVDARAAPRLEVACALGV
jgi:heme oxygenase